MSYRIQYRRATAAVATANNVVLAAGEPGLETDTGKVKVGDGITAWNALAYEPSTGSVATAKGEAIAAAAVDATDKAAAAAAASDPAGSAAAAVVTAGTNADTKIADERVTERANQNSTYVSVIKPEKYGAVGDGVADDTAALLATVAAAAPGDTIDLGHHVYLVSAPVVVSAELTIVAERGEIRGAAGFTGAAVLTIAPTVACPVTLNGVRVTLPNNHASNVLSITNVAVGNFSRVSLSGGQQGMNIGSSVHNSFFTDIGIANAIDGIWIEGDTSTAELFFSNVDIEAGSNATAANSGITIHRIVAAPSDVGGYSFVNTLIAMGARACAYGLQLDASTVTGNSSSPVYWTGCAIDGVVTPIRAAKWGNVYVENGWCFSDDVTADVVRLEGCNDISILNHRLKGGANGIAFRGGASSKVQIGWNRMPDVTYAYFFDAATSAVTGLRIDGDSIFSGDSSTRLTNNAAKLQDSLSDPTYTNPRRFLTKSTNSIYAMAVVNELGHKKWWRVGATNNWQIFDSAVTQAIMDMTDTGDVVFKGTVAGSAGLLAPTASPAFTGAPTGITKTHVGLSNVDNTSDVNKPVSTAQAAALEPLDSNRLAVGESTFSRQLVNSAAVTLSNQTMRVTYFTARKTETINSLRISSGTTAAGATPTLVRIGIYSVGAGGALTALVASIASDTTIFAAASTTYTRTLTAPFAKVAGTRYAVGVLVVTGAAAPTAYGAMTGMGPENYQDPAITGSVGAMSDLPSSLAAGGLTGTTFATYVALIP